MNADGTASKKGGQTAAAQHTGEHAELAQP